MAGKRKSYKERKNGKRSKKYTTKKYRKEAKAVKLYYPGVCPDVMATKLTFNENRTVNEAGINVRVYRGNSVFDPDFTGVGGQPLGRDQWTQFYRRYRVTASKFTVKFSCLTDSTVGVQVILVPLTTSTALSDPEQYLEAHNAKVSKVTFDTGSSSDEISCYMTVAEMRGSPADIVQYDSNLSSIAAAVPAHQFFWHVVTFDSSGGLNTVNAHINEKIEYWTEFYDRTTLPRS